MRSTKLPSWTERLLGLDPVPVPPRVFAVDGARLRYAAFNRADGRLDLAEYHEEPLPDVFAQGHLGGALREAGLFREVLERLLARLGEGPRSASLVLPDGWLRLVFTESGELPRNPERRDEVLRWKLKRLVPFRVEELRLAAVGVAPLPQQEEPGRLLLGFAIESLLAGLEAEFASHGVQVGQITNASLGILGAVRPLVAPAPLGAVVGVDSEGYTLLLVRRGELMLQRAKPFSAGGDPVLGREAVRRDLRMTRAFVAEQLPDEPLARTLLVTTPELESEWAELAGEALGAPVETLRRERLSLRLDGPAVGWRDVLPLAGAALQEVA